jgi:hypothetical protein
MPCDASSCSAERRCCSCGPLPLILSGQYVHRSDAGQSSARLRAAWLDAGAAGTCTRRGTRLELALLAQQLVFPLFGIATTLAKDSLIAAIFTAVSQARSFLLRRMFEHLGQGSRRDTR